MQVAVIQALAVGWLIACLAAPNFANPQRFTGDYPDGRSSSRLPSQIQREIPFQSSLNSPYESIDQFQIEQQQLPIEPGQSQPRYNYEDRYSSRFRNDQESYYQSLLRVTENPSRESRIQDTLTGPRESQAFYQDYLPLDDNENFNVKQSRGEKSHKVNNEKKKNSSDQKVAAIAKKLPLKDNSRTTASLNDLQAQNYLENKMRGQQASQVKRGVRQVRAQQPGFLWTIARLAFEKVNDTKSAVNQIGTIISNAIATDDRPTTVATTTTTTTTSSSNDIDLISSNVNNNTISGSGRPTSTTTTTEAPFRLSRPVLRGIIRRNVKGLIRLFNVEWRDALNASRKSVSDFKRDFGNQVRPFLEDNPKVFG